MAVYTVRSFLCQSSQSLGPKVTHLELCVADALKKDSHLAPHFNFRVISFVRELIKKHLKVILGYVLLQGSSVLSTQ